MTKPIIVRVVVISIALGSPTFPFGAQTARADGGEMIIIRQVPARPAYRAGGEGPVTSAIDVANDDKVLGALGLNRHPGGHIGRELNDRDIAGVVTGERAGGVPQQAISQINGPSATRESVLGTQRLAPPTGAQAFTGSIPSVISSAMGERRFTDVTSELANTLTRVLPATR
jgi:hypothetical protein